MEFCFPNSYNPCKPCKRSITFELPLKGILKIYIYTKCFKFVDDSLGNICSISIFRFTAYFEISNQNHHHQIGYNNNILTQIINNLLERNTMRLTWKLLLHGDWITQMDYFERVEQMIITLFKTRDFVIINIQAVRIESHKQSLQIVWKYSKKWQKNGDLN